MREERNPIAGQAVRIAAAIGPLVVMADDGTNGLERTDRAAQVVADGGMPLHQLVLFPRQAALFEQHPIGNGDLADVVDKAAAIKRVEIRPFEIQVLAQRDRVLGQALAMTLGARIARLDDAPQREEERLGRLQIVGETLQPHQRTDARVQLLGIDRLVEKVVGAGVEARQARLAFLLTADQHDGRQARLRIPLELGAHIETRDPRHHDVEQHEIGTLRLDDFERVAAVGRRQDGVVGKFEQPAQPAHVGLIVIDYQDFPGL